MPENGREQLRQFPLLQQPNDEDEERFDINTYGNAICDSTLI
jgi:hypothetical protein